MLEHRENKFYLRIEIKKIMQFVMQFVAMWINWRALCLVKSVRGKETHSEVSRETSQKIIKCSKTIKMKSKRTGF